MSATARPAAPAGAEPILRIEQVSKRFGATTAVDSVSLDVGRGEIFALLGSSGCGKSTLLRIVAGFEVPDKGRIVLDGEDLGTTPAHRRPTGLMFQSYALFPHMSVAGNVAFGLRQMRPRLAAARVRERVHALLELVQLSALAGRSPHQLSGGQQQRVALARCLAREPKLLLLDEPLSALDKQIRQRTQLELVALVRRVSVSCVIVTHDQEEAMAMADRIGVMSPQGQLLQMGRPHEIYESPSTRYTATFIGETNLFEGRVERGGLRCAGLEHPLAVPDRGAAGGAVTSTEGSAAWLSVRPERLRLRPGPPVAAVVHDASANRLPATVTGVAYLGSHSLVQLRTGSGQPLIASLPRGRQGDRPPPRDGDAMTVEWDPLDGILLLR